MEVNEAILTRRSIRKFIDKEINQETLLEIIKAGMYAPSARNFQPWQFIIITNRKLLSKIPDVHPYAEMVPDAALAVCVCGDLSIEKSPEYNAVNCSAATQNMLLSARSFGIGSVWLGVYPREERINGLKNLLSLPDYILPISLIAFGYPDEFKSTPDRFLPDRIHTNSW